jgi:hypothetical protein
MKNGRNTGELIDFNSALAVSVTEIQRTNVIVSYSPHQNDAREDSILRDALGPGSRHTPPRKGLDQLHRAESSKNSRLYKTPMFIIVYTTARHLLFRCFLSWT